MVKGNKFRQTTTGRRAFQSDSEREYYEMQKAAVRRKEKLKRARTKTVKGGGVGTLEGRNASSPRAKITPATTTNNNTTTKPKPVKGGGVGTLEGRNTSRAKITPPATTTKKVIAPTTTRKIYKKVRGVETPPRRDPVVKPAPNNAAAASMGGNNRITDRENKQIDNALLKQKREKAIIDAAKKFFSPSDSAKAAQAKRKALVENKRMKRKNEKERIAAENAKLAEIRRTETPEERLKRIGYKGFNKGGTAKKTYSAGGKIHKGKFNKLIESDKAGQKRAEIANEKEPSKTKMKDLFKNNKPEFDRLQRKFYTTKARIGKAFGKNAGGMVKAYKKGGLVKKKSIDGIALRGKTRATRSR